MVLIALILVAIYAATRLMQVDIPEEPKRVSVVVENSGSERWNSYFMGIEQAASDKGVEVSKVMTSYFSDEATRDLMVTSEYLGGANVVITKVEPDAHLVADMLSKELIGEYGGVMADRSVALFSGSKYDAFTTQVAALFSEDIKKAGGEILWEQNSPCDVSRLLKKSKRTDIIVSLDDESLSQAAAYLDTKKSDRRRLIGIGCSPNCVYYLDRGIIDAMLVPDDFTLGYESLMTAVEERDMSAITPEMKMVHPFEVYEKENEKLLFP